MSNLTMPRARPATTTEQIRQDADITQQAIDRVTHWLSRYSILILRVALGMVFLGFGVLKFIPGASPAEDLAAETVEILSFGILSGTTAVVATAITETIVGLTLITGKFLRAGLVVMGASVAGMLSTLVLFFDDMFTHGVTLEAQYVVKDFVLIAAGLVIAARALGAKMVVDQPTTRV